MGKLTDNQERFVQELIKGKSQREAYRIAYPNCKASDKTVDENACRLMNTSKVSARYNEIHDRLIQEAEDECIVSAKEVLQELKRIGFADIKDFLSFRTEKTVVSRDEEDGEPIIDYAQIIDMVDSEKVDGRVIQEVSLSYNGTFKFKLYDKMSALEKLGKHLRLFTDKLEVTSNAKDPFDELTEDELRQLIDDD